MTGPGQASLLYDAYLSAVLAGQEIAPERFLAERGASDPDLASALRAVARLHRRQAIDARPLAADAVDGYRIHARIGSGGMGVLYLAVQEALDRPVALKVLRGRLAGDADARARFAREARALARLDHPNVVRVLDAGRAASGADYLAMELVDGRSLTEVLAEGPPPVDVVVAWFVDLAGALAAAHAAGVLHRDVKPDNILIDRDGRPILVDFGLSLLAEEGSRTATFIGTAPFAAPEQLAGRGDRHDGRTDVYGLAATLFHALTGEFPHGLGSPPEVLARLEANGPPSAAALGEALDRLLSEAMATDPDDRPPDATALARRLADVARPAPPVARTGRRMAVGVGLALVIVAALGALARSAPDADPIAIERGLVASLPEVRAGDEIDVPAVRSLALSFHAAADRPMVVVDGGGARRPGESFLIGLWRPGVWDHWPAGEGMYVGFWGLDVLVPVEGIVGRRHHLYLEWDGDRRLRVAIDGRWRKGHLSSDPQARRPALDLAGPSIELPWSPVARPRRLRLGRGLAGLEHAFADFEGSLAELSVWDRILDPTEVERVLGQVRDRP